MASSDTAPDLSNDMDIVYAVRSLPAIRTNSQTVVVDSAAYLWIIWLHELVVVSAQAGACEPLGTEYALSVLCRGELSSIGQRQHIRGTGSNKLEIPLALQRPPWESWGRAGPSLRTLPPGSHVIRSKIVWESWRERDPWRRVWGNRNAEEIYGDYAE